MLDTDKLDQILKDLAEIKEQVAEVHKLLRSNTDIDSSSDDIQLHNNELSALQIKEKLIKNYFKNRPNNVKP
jgi:hypothetical protein